MSVAYVSKTCLTALNELSSSLNLSSNLSNSSSNISSLFLIFEMKPNVYKSKSLIEIFTSSPNASLSLSSEYDLFRYFSLKYFYQNL